MSVLLLRLKGPQQSWGASSKYSTREAGAEPSKSGVLGLIAAAQGRLRTDSIADLLDLRFGVRVDQPGRLMVDYQTAKKPGAAHSQLSWREYRADAAYVAAVAGPDELIEDIAQAVESPEFSLYLGRRSFPAPPGLVMPNRYPGEDVEKALRDLDAVPWIASNWYKKSAPTTVYLSIARDALPGEPGDTVSDVPVSFDPRDRRYTTRIVARPAPVVVANEMGREPRDPFFDTVKEG